MDALAFTPGRAVGKYPADSRNINPDLSVLFVHNPRCAGRSICAALGIMGSHDTQGSLYGKYADHLGELFKVGVVRDPLQRYLSAYRWRQAEKKIVEAEHRIDLRRLRGVSLEECTKMLLDEPDLLAAHLAPQSYYIPEPEKLDYLIRYESLADGWRHVCRKLRVSIELPHANRAEGETEAAEWVIDAVHKMYRADYDLFGYPRHVRRTGVVKLAHGAAGIAKAVTGTGGATSQMVERRTAICGQCPHWRATAAIGQCQLCGCLTWAKVRNANEKCPDGRW